jgi:hypothetical protein
MEQAFFNKQNLIMILKIQVKIDKHVVELMKDMNNMGEKDEVNH